ncbi:MAG: hypothetical protein HYZ36_04400, partial [Pedosphaera parvula]|nr:hypothetical protein [Pedosphaera parvula]
FLSELLSLPGGQAGMREMLRLLPQHMNWQFAFLRAYQSHFQTALDVEKWWSVTVINFLGRDRHAKWPMEMGLQRLDTILRATVEVHSTNALPQRTEIRLQAFLEQVDYPQQRPALQTIVSQLKMLQWSVPTDLLKLVDDYRFALESYLARRDGLIGPAATSGGSRPAAYPLVRATIKQLDLLDVLRGDFKKYGITPVAAASDRPTQQP